MAPANIDSGFYPSKAPFFDIVGSSTRVMFPPADRIARVESATADDIDDLLPLMRDFYAGERLPFDEAVLRKALAELWREPLHGGVWLARVGGQATGYGVLCCGFSLEYRGRDAFVDELFVRPEWRNAGIGGRILDAMEAACRESGIEALHLEVDHDNPEGRRLYARRGFVDHDRHLMTKWLDR